jgi:hypothetical protein
LSTWPRTPTNAIAATSIRAQGDATANQIRQASLTAGILNAQNCGAVTFDGAYAHHLGLLAATLGHWDRADDHLADAAAVHERMAARVYLTRTRLAWAATLLNRRRPGDGERADQLLGEAISAARELGLTNTERHAAALLAPARREPKPFR